MSSDIKKEFYKLDPTKTTIGLLMMVKNEHKRIHVTLESVIGHVDALIFYDTGSTDNTVQIIEEFAEKHKINLYLRHGSFTNFAVSRNESLDFADTVDVKYLLLLDCNDELKGGEELRKICTACVDKENTGFLVCQQWWCGQLDKYYNIRLVKPRNGWRYRGSVHEWIKDTLSNNDQPRFPVVRLDDTIFIYQDRTQDDDKTKNRFTRDKELLLADYKKNPKDPRTVFYLAQTCQCLGQHDEALYYSKIRLDLVGFVEERFHAYIRCGDSSTLLGHDFNDCIKWYLRAYEEFQRAEPLVKIADLYRKKATVLASENENCFNIWRTAYMFIHEACKLSYPEHCILFVDKGIYDYYGWHLMGIIGFYAKEYAEGKEACLKAIKNGTNKELNEKNLQFYLNHENENKPVIPSEVKTEITKQEFLKMVIGNLQKEFPKSNLAQLEKKANMMWKLKNKKVNH